MRVIIVSGGNGQFSGTHIAAIVTRRELMALVQLRSLSILDQLSEKQMAIARFAAEGLSHKEIGRRLGLSPITARNYLGHVYRKLGVGNKLQLAEKLRALD